jgi:hypothetical protein
VLKKHNSLCLLGFFAVSTAMLIGQSKYSGIYSGWMSVGGKVVFAMTTGGRVLGLSEYSLGLSDALNPANSIIDSSGKLKGVTPTGAVVTARVASDFKITGTIKEGGLTARFKGSRIYK